MKYSELANFYNDLESTTKRLEKTHIISEFLKKINKKDVSHLAYLISGKVFPSWDERKLGVSSRLILKALEKSTGIQASKVERLWAKKGDLGLVSEEISSKSKQTTLQTINLTTKKVFENIRKLSSLEGTGTVDRKLGLISELLTSAEPLEAKYIVRTVLEDMRTGVATGTFRDAITWAFFGEKLGLEYLQKENNFTVPDREEYNKFAERVQHAYDLSNDFSLVIETLIEKGEGGLNDIKLTIGKPINVMLYKKVENIKEGFEKVGSPCAVEVKLDGFRVLVNKDKEIKLFTRRLEDVTKQFPDIVKLIDKNVKGDNYILDAEVVGIDLETKRRLPFQHISQRIKRKYNIEEIIKKVPVILSVFDVVAYKGESVLSKPFKERRKIIEKIVKPVKDHLEITKQIITSDEKKVQKFYDESLGNGDEGIMMKNLEGVYKPGSRVGYGVKVKPILETLDLVITGAEWGEGKRASWLSSFTISCKDGDNLLELGKVGTGIKEKDLENNITFSELTKLLTPLITGERGKSVTIKPKIIIEVAYEEIQKSTNYNSGYALRFPRLINIRSDLGTNDVKTLDEVRRIYSYQRGRNK
jgi:DNA ligase 1